jgi:hypothetical protein
MYPEGCREVVAGFVALLINEKALPRRPLSARLGTFVIRHQRTIDVRNHRRVFERQCAPSSRLTIVITPDAAPSATVLCQQRVGVPRFRPDRSSNPLR